MLQRLPGDTLNKLLRGPMAAVRCAQILAYLNDMSRILRSGLPLTLSLRLFRASLSEFRALIPHNLLQQSQ